MLKFILYAGTVLILLLFWVVGAYGRLARLRTAVAQALEPLEQLWRQQLDQARRVLPDAESEPEPEFEPEPGSDPDSDAAEAGPDPATLVSDACRQRLAAAVHQFELSLHRLHERPTRSRAVEMLELARHTLHQAWRQAADELPAVGPDEPVQAGQPENDDMPDLQEQWAVLGHQEQPPLAAFNAAMRDYDRAVSQFPTLLLARPLGFRRGRQLARDPWSAA